MDIEISKAPVSVVGKHRLINDRVYRIEDTGTAYVGGEYPSGGLVIFVWHPPASAWRFVCHSPGETEARSFLSAAARSAAEGTQWGALPNA